MAVAMLDSSSEGLCLEGLLAAILLRAAMVAVGGVGGKGKNCRVLRARWRRAELRFNSTDDFVGLCQRVPQPYLDVC
jgi:hypothetical protein